MIGLNRNNDLISREVLKDALIEAHINKTLTFDIATFTYVMNTINNATTVSDKYDDGWLDGYYQGFMDAVKRGKKNE